MSIPFAPFLKGKNYNPAFIAKYGIPKYANSALNPKVIGTPDWQVYWNEVLYYIKNGYQTGGLFIPGRYFYYLNFNTMATVAGMIAPDMVDLHLELSYLIEYAKAEKKNIIVAKKRRAGISEFTHKAVIDYGWRFTNGAYHAGIAGGREVYVQDLIGKWRANESLLPPELRIKKLKDNNDLIEAGYRYRNEAGEMVEAGTKNRIYLATMGRDPALFKGKFLNDVVAEECGEFEKLEKFFQHTRPCVMDGSKQVGTMFFYGCVCAGTKVWTNNGELINIEDLKPDKGIIGFDIEKGVFSNEEITYWQPPHEKDCYRIVTRSGRILECSDDHPILCSRLGSVSGPRGKKKKKFSWIEAGKIRPGDQVSIINEVPVWGDKKMWEPRVIGWLIGDGSYGFDKTPRLSSCDKEINDYVESNFNTALDRPPRLTKTGKIYKETRIKEICPQLRLLGIYGQVKTYKRLPLSVNDYSKKDISEMIGGLYDTDGCAYYTEGKICWIVLTSCSLEMLKEVQLVLQKFGIHGGISKIKARPDLNPIDKNDYYRLTVSDRLSLIAFHDNISFSVEYKQQKLNQIYEHYKNLKTVTPRLFSGMRAELVRSVEYIGKKPVYNLTAGTTNTYIANGIITHNTGGNMMKGGRDFEIMWDQAENNNFIKFLIPATRFHKPFYGGCSTDTPNIPNLLKTHRPHELIGVEDYKAAEEAILKERQDILATGNIEKYQEHLRDYPMTKEDIFSLSVNNDFDAKILNDQRNAISSNSCKYVRCQLDWAKDKDGAVKTPREVLLRIDNNVSEEGVCILIHQDHLTPLKSHMNIYCAGIDSYDQNKAITSKSKGAMCVLIRRNDVPGALQMAPVATICIRPDVKETFYDMCLKLAVYFDLQGSVLIDVMNKLIFEWFENSGYQSMLAYRPKKFEQEKSQQTTTYGVHLNNYSKPLMVGIMQSAIVYHGDQIWFPDLIKQLANYNQVTIGSDNDLADAYGIALMQNSNEDVPARSRNYYDDKNITQLREWTTDASGNIVPKGEADQNVISLEQDVPGRFLSI